MTLWDAGRTLVRRSVVMALVVAALLVFAACGGNGDTDPEQEPEQDVVETAVPSGPTNTPEPPAEPTMTATPEATSTPEPTATATPSPTPEPPTPTPTVTPTPTATPLPTLDNPFGDAAIVTDALPNYTLTYSARITGPDEDASVDLFIAQSAPDVYHLRIASAGQQTEAWRVDNVTYVLGPGGAVVELPGLVDENLYSPASFLFLVPDLRSVGVATIVDEQADVAGRDATHFRIDTSVANAFLPPQSDAGTDVEGTFDVWVDNELNVIIQMQADIEWSGAGNQNMQMDYLITEIGTTPDIQPPG